VRLGCPSLFPARARETLRTLKGARGSLDPWKLNRKRLSVSGSLTSSSPSSRVLTDEAGEMLLRKEVIQPQVPLRLPCYDFTPVTVHSLGPCLSCELA
jgi:hypothetical protein